MARKKISNQVPSFDELIIPTVKALVELGGSGSNEEINTKVYELHNISDEIINIPHGENGTVSEVDYRLAWSKTYLKKFGLLENSSRGIWSLINTAVDISTLDSFEIVKYVREQDKNNKQNKKMSKSSEELIQETKNEVDYSEEWKEKLLNILYNILILDKIMDT